MFESAARPPPLDEEQLLPKHGFDRGRKRVDQGARAGVAARVGIVAVHEAGAAAPRRACARPRRCNIRRCRSDRTARPHGWRRIAPGRAPLGCALRRRAHAPACCWLRRPSIPAEIDARGRRRSSAPLPATSTMSSPWSAISIMSAIAVGGISSSAWRMRKWVASGGIRLGGLV